MKLLNKSLLFGFLGSLSLLVFYFLIMSLGRSSFSSALEQLTMLRVWIIPLVITFGIEIGLFTYVRNMHKASGKSTMVSGTTSSVAMVACCAHHITDILPLVGFSLLATFLTAYQPWFFAIGIISNLVAILLLIKQLSWAPKHMTTIAILLSPLVIIGIGYLLATSTNISTTSSPNTTQGNKTYQAQENDEKQVAVSATPKTLSSSQNVVFDVAMNNHMYELSYDLAKTAVLTDSSGNTYKPLSWNGSTGGHHVSGQLTFPKLAPDASQVSLTLPGIVGVDRTFSWNL